MKIDHLSIWVDDLERMKDFYTHYFNASANDKYTNTAKQFTSYFISFPQGGPRLELMNRPNVLQAENERGNVKGLTHFAFSVGAKEVVDAMTEKFRRDGYTIFSEPRTTGDGYYESVILDPEGNHLEITE